MLEKGGGFFVLRIEDTDQERSSKEAETAIYSALRWLGLDYDEGPYPQSQRLGHYQTVIQRLLDQGKAYYCDCSKDEIAAMRVAALHRGDKHDTMATAVTRRKYLPLAHRPLFDLKIRRRAPLS